MVANEDVEMSSKTKDKLNRHKMICNKCNAEFYDQKKTTSFCSVSCHRAYSAKRSKNWSISKRENIKAVIKSRFGDDL